jgi:hypothetical protein
MILQFTNYIIAFSIMAKSGLFEFILEDHPGFHPRPAEFSSSLGQCGAIVLASRPQ